MSIILDALRKVEREDGSGRRESAHLDHRALETASADTAGFFHRRHLELLAAGGLLAFAGGFCFTAAVTERNPLHPAAAEALTINETAVTVSTASESGNLARRGGEERRNSVQLSAHEEPHGAASPMEKTGFGSRGERGGISPRKTAGPVFSAAGIRNKPRGIEPPVRPGVQAAPAPVFLLDGIVYHNDEEKRAVLLRVRDGESALLNIGNQLRGHRVVAIGQSSVTLAGDGGKNVELAIE